MLWSMPEVGLSALIDGVVAYVGSLDVTVSAEDRAALATRLTHTMDTLRGLAAPAPEMATPKSIPETRAARERVERLVREIATMVLKRTARQVHLDAIAARYTPNEALRLLTILESISERDRERLSDTTVADDLLAYLLRNRALGADRDAM